MLNNAISGVIGDDPDDIKDIYGNIPATDAELTRVCDALALCLDGKYNPGINYVKLPGFPEKRAHLVIFEWITDDPDANRPYTIPVVDKWFVITDMGADE